MSIWRRIRDRVLEGTCRRPGPATAVELHEVYQRRFLGHDEARFVVLWNELATVLNAAPLELNENSRIDELLDAAAKKTGDTPVGILDDVLAFAVDNSTGDPGPDWTVGGLIEWLLDNDSTRVVARRVEPD